MPVTTKHIFVALALLATAGGGAFYYAKTQSKLPAGISASNGRIEAQTIDIATRSGGRVVDVAVEEGAMVKAGEVVAKIDLNTIAASVTGAEANVRAAEQQKQAANSQVSQAKSALALAQKEYDRVARLVTSGAVSRSRYDQALNQKQAAEASLAASQQRLASSKENVDVARADVNRLKDLLSDQDLKASRSGRVLYKLAEPGEVVGAGGRVITLIDLTDVYMTCFFSTDIVGKLKMGDEARIVLDALPDLAIPAYISYISPEAQFTPRLVETKAEREKMTFRVKIRIPPALLQKHMDVVKTGVPGMAYVRTDGQTIWPKFLTVRADIAQEAREK
jgi:HlyD family secretion protein